MANEDRMQTVAGALDQFRDRGYRQEMAIKAGRLQVDGTDRTYRPDEVLVRDYWRYEGVSDPGDESVVYAIETSDGVRGTLVDAYNAYADPSVGEFLRAVTTTARPVIWCWRCGRCSARWWWPRCCTRSPAVWSARRWPRSAWGWSVTRG